MAFRPYELVQTKSIILHPGEVPNHQPVVWFPLDSDQSVSIQLWLGFSVSGGTSSITHQSSLPMMKRLSPSKYMELVNAARAFSLYLSAQDNASFIKSWKSEKSSSAINKRLSPSKYMELVNAARSFSLYLSAEDNASFIKSWSSEKSSSAINKRLMAPQDIYPIYKDALAAQVNGPMKKRKKSPKRIEFGQVAAEQLDEPNKKKRKVQKKIKCGPIVKSEVTEQLESCIRETLKDEEKTDLHSGKEIVVPLLGPTLTMYAEPMKLKIWPMGRTHNYMLMNKWNNFVEENKDCLKQFSTIQLWSFHVDQQLCFALAVVERPLANGVDV
nr:hypothetical protein [Tanacetum cinerariifolium]